MVGILELDVLRKQDLDLPARVADELVALLYGRQWWTHHLYLLISCLPVVLLYFGLYGSRTVPRALALFGIVAAVVMAAEMVGVMLGDGISDLLFVPIALVQLTTPLWLLARGLTQED